MFQLLVLQLRSVMRVQYQTFSRKIHKTINNRKWNVLFFGTDDFSLESLKILHANVPKILSNIEVVTANDDYAVAKYARHHEISVTKWPFCKKPNNFDTFDIGIVVSFGYLIPSDVINAFPLGMINLHGSLLPRWRGSCPIHFALMKGDKETGVTIMKIMPNKFDIGDIIAQEKVSIGPDETILELRGRLAKIGATLLLKTIEELPQSFGNSKAQNDTEATYAHKISAKLAIIKWQEMSAADVYNLYRGLADMFLPQTTFEHKAIKLLDISVYNKTAFVQQFEMCEPGTVVYDKKFKALLIKCKENTWISVRRVIVERKHVTAASAFSSTYLSGMHRKTLLFS